MMYIYIYEHIRTGRRMHRRSFRRLKNWRVVGVYLN